MRRKEWGSNWGRPRRCSQAQAASRHRGAPSSLLGLVPEWECTPQQPESWRDGQRPASRVPCVLASALSSASLLLRSYPLPVDQYRIQNPEPRMQNADRREQSKARQGTQAQNPLGRPWCVVAGSRFHVSNQWRAGAGVGSSIVHTRDTAQIGAAVSVSGGGSCFRSSLHIITIFNFAQNVRAKSKKLPNSITSVCSVPTTAVALLLPLLSLLPTPASPCQAPRSVALLHPRSRNSQRSVPVC